MARFDHLAHAYDRLNPYGHGAQMLAGLKPEPHHTILDVGGGTGQVGDALRTECARYVVADQSPGMLAQTRSRRPWIHAVKASGERLPVRTASVDRVVMVDALHHVRDQAACLREVARVLRPGGRAVVEEFQMDRWWKRWGLVTMERLMFFGSRFRRSGGWQRLFSSAGLVVESTVRVSWRDVQFVLVKR